MDRSPPRVKEVNNLAGGAGLVTRLNKRLDEARRCASAPDDAVLLLKSVFSLRLSLY